MMTQVVEQAQADMCLEPNASPFLCAPLEDIMQLQPLINIHGMTDAELRALLFNGTTTIPLAPIPLPAPALLLFGALGVLYLLKRIGRAG